MAEGPSLIVLLSDGIWGHLFQSRGVAGWLSGVSRVRYHRARGPEIERVGEGAPSQMEGPVPALC